jgi:hypothetical protein
MENFSPVRKTLSFGSSVSPPTSPVRNPFADLNGSPEVRKSLFGSPEMITGCSQRRRFPPKKMGPQPPNHNCNRGKTANLFPEGTEVVGEIPQQASAHSCCVAGFRSFLMLTGLVQPAWPPILPRAGGKVANGCAELQPVHPGNGSNAGDRPRQVGGGD